MSSSNRGELGRVVDPEALDRSAKPSAQVEVDVRGEWLSEGSELEISLPKRLVCASCSGGGCSKCQNRGAFSLDDGASVHLQLSPSETRPTRVRVTRPFGDAAEVDTLFVDLRPSDVPSLRVRREAPIVHSPDLAPAPSPSPPRVGTFVLCLLALGGALWLLLRWLG